MRDDILEAYRVPNASIQVSRVALHGMPASWTSSNFGTVRGGINHTVGLFAGRVDPCQSSIWGAEGTAANLITKAIKTRSPPKKPSALYAGPSFRPSAFSFERSSYMSSSFERSNALPIAEISFSPPMQIYGGFGSSMFDRAAVKIQF